MKSVLPRSPTQNAYCNPKPIQKPSPSIMVGGSGEQTLKVVVKYADACNLSESPEVVVVLTHVGNTGKKA
ncbi:MAG: hypothetical protein WAK17_02890 [Candidatus Nitrosopolaris sp.]